MRLVFSHPLWVAHKRALGTSTITAPATPWKKWWPALGLVAAVPMSGLCAGSATKATACAAGRPGVQRLYRIRAPLSPLGLQVPLNGSGPPSSPRGMRRSGSQP